MARAFNGGAAAHKRQAREPEEAQPWPRGVSREPIMAIGQVVKVLEKEFPATTVSKVRFLEDKGLVSPHRTAAGYRKYSQADVERIRFILAKQRDSYAPLRVIGEELQALDAGHDLAPTPRARLVSSDGVSVAPSHGRTVTVRELGELTGSSRDQIELYVKLGLISPDLGGHFPGGAVRAVRLINDLVASGLPARNLRAIRSGAERAADIIDQAVSSSTRRDRPGDRERARAQAEELAEHSAALHAAFLQIAVESLGE